MPAQYLKFRIAGEAFRATVPAYNMAVRVKHADRVVFDRVNEALEAINSEIILVGTNIIDLTHAGFLPAPRDRSNVISGP